MKPTALTLLACFSALGLSACGSESPEPVEQIVVREPGQAAETGAGGGAAGSETLAGGLVEAGRSAFAACAACHAVASGEGSGAGPNLYGVVGRTAGALEDFGYSEAMAASGVVWDEASLDAFLTNPAAKVPGTSMVAGAVGDGTEREAIIAYLASLSE